jgi:hypothetical protein
MPADPELFTPGGISAPGYRGAPQTKQWMEDRGPVQQGGNGTPPRGPIVNNPRIPLLTKAVTGAVLLGMLYGKDYWLRPTLKVSVKPKSTGFWDWLNWTVASIQKFLNPRVHHVTHEVSKGAAHVAEGPTRTINLLALRWEQLTYGVTYLAHDIANALEHLTRVHVPHAIKTAVRPVIVHVTIIEHHITRITRHITRVERYVHVQVDKIIKPEIRRITRTVTHVLPARINKVEVKISRTITRVKTLERGQAKLLTLLTVTGAVALVLRAFARMGLNYLRCQNMKDVGRDICASPPGSGKRLGRFLRDILGMTAGVLFASQFCRILVLVVEGAAPIATKLVETLAVAESALCNNRYDAAPPLPLNVTANPPTPNALVL